MRRLFVLFPAALLAASAVAQPTVDGTLDPLYCAPISVQQNQTGFGNASQGNVGSPTGGSELDAAYAHIDGGVLYLFLSGNLETNFNKLEVFFDTVAGGQNRLLGGVTDGGDNLNRMGANNESNGLRFDTGFEADYWFSCTVGNNPLELYADFADIPTAAGGTKVYLGTTGAATSGVLSGGTNPDGIRVTINNSNTGGVAGGSGLDLSGLAATVNTGIEIAIPLSTLGNPAAPFKVCAFVNGQGHDFVSNQVLGSLGGIGNLGEPRNVDFSLLAGDQFFTVQLVTPPCGACCIGTSCSLTTAADCSGDFQGANTGCSPNPCVEAPTGACCVGTSCSIENQADCNNLFGEYLGDDTTCAGSPCLTGGCCVGTSCLTLREAQCDAQSGAYLGNGTDCGGSPCATGACCVGTSCQEVRLSVCNADGGLYFGDNTTCGAGQCTPGACCFGIYCIETLAQICTNQGGTNFGAATSCTPARCSTPAEPIAVDGALDGDYCEPQAVQITQTGFGDSNLGVQDFANGSELAAAYATIANGRLYVMLAGNLESNFNKIDLFFDTRAGGQNRLIGENPGVDFGALNRMGDDGSGNGLTFDAGFAADFWISCGGGGSPYRMFVNYAELADPGDPITNPGIGFYLGSGKAANATNGGLLDADVGAINPFGILVTIDNSNTLGVSGGQSALDAAGIAAAAAVTTGVELVIPLSAIGNPASLEDISIVAFVNAPGHDFGSNQFLGGLGGAEPRENIADPRNVSLAAIDGEQSVALTDTCVGGCLIGDVNCDGVVNNFDIDFFVDIIVDGSSPVPPPSWINRGGTPECWDQRNCTANINRDENGANNFDIDPFVLCIVNPPAMGEPCPAP
ncbi:MAG: hypothetical protein IPM64_05230 [Phycisphaerales bacterium]|nr:hypothetical protein [Phycisphaerales bacterium]